MSSFPTAYDQEAAPPTIRATECPYAGAEMAQYLDWCHEHHLVQEPSGSFGAPVFCCTSRDADHTLWLWRVADPKQRTWWLIVGSGRSPFYGETLKLRWRWMWAWSAAGETDEQALAQARREHQATLST
jgi:hypothetical protein